MRIIFLSFIFLATVLNNQALAAGPWKGRIIDIETKEPLEGAVVLAVWQRIYRTPTGDSSYFYEAKEVVTDKNGRFEIPSYTPINLLPIISYMRGPYFIIFKPSYISIEWWHGEYFLENPNEKPTGEFEWLYNKDIKYKLAPGFIELSPLKTWEERNKASIISPYDNPPKSKWPLLHEMREKEDEWLRNNKGWRRSGK